MDFETDRSWHAMEADEIKKYFHSDEQAGLNSNEVEKRRNVFGPNALPEPPKKTLLEIFLKQFKSPLIYLLLGAVLIAFLVSEVSDSIVILAVVILNSIIGSIQEKRAAQSLESLRRLSKQMVKVRRANHEQIIEARDVVPGDILLLEPGDAITADARIISSRELKVAEAALTGESLPVEKSAEIISPESILADRKNMLFSGTFVNAGRAMAIVTATGQNTEVGKIARLATEKTEPPTPLEQKVAQFGKMIIYLAAILFPLIIAVGLWRGLNLSEVFMVGISQVVSMIPEGLPVAITIALAVGVRRMAHQGAIIRRLAAVETLGSTNIICTDKTGTLTRNEMTVREIYLPQNSSKNGIIEVSGEGYTPHGEFKYKDGTSVIATDDSALMKILKAATLCNDSRLIPPGAENDHWKVVGDPTEAALIAVAGKAGIQKKEIENEHPRKNEIPFDSSLKLMATEHLSKNGSIIYLKGAPEQVIHLSSVNENVLNIASEMADQALRVLAFAELENGTLTGTQELLALKGKFKFLGFMGQMDPPRKEVIDAVKECQSAGIRAVMVTGDHKGTGLAIGKMIGMASADDQVMEGIELDKMSDSDLDNKLDKISIFARVHPEQKLRIVEAYQRKGRVVAMTGDGVNDSPALARADVGVAMGVTGTETAKEAAKIVLTDDNFTTIVQAVKQGRLVYRNVKKLILYLFTTGLSEILVLFGALIFGYPPPLAAVQILWINLVTDGAMSITLIMEPEEGDEMKHQPIPRKEPLINKTMAQRMMFLSPAIVISTLGYFIYSLYSGRPFNEIQTGTFTVLAVSQWFNALNCRSHWQSVFKMNLLKNQWLIGGLLAGNALQAAVIYLPFMNSIFHTVPIDLHEVMIIGVISSLVLWVEEIRKSIMKLRKNPTHIRVSQKEI